MKLFKLIFPICIVFFFQPDLVKADTWAEREMLAKIEKELSDLNALIQAAQKQKVEGARYKFDYAVLLSDIAKIRQGITGHLGNRLEPVIPSEIKPLNTAYTGLNQQ